MNSEPPLPSGPAPPLPPNAQPPTPYDGDGYPQQQQQQQQPHPGQQVWKCETCVKSFLIASQYEAHVGTHVTCSDCDFSASKRVVTAHHQTAHGQYAGQGLKEIDVEGQKFMVLVGNSAEDIAKWREERRKRWLAMSRQPKPEATVTETEPVAGKRKLSVSSEDLEEGEIEEDEEAKGQIVLRNALAAPEAGTQEPPAKKQRKTALCKWFTRGHCRYDDAHCKYSHDRSAFGCRAMMFKGSCAKGMYCPFSHDAAVLTGQRERSQKASKERVTEQQWRGEQKSLLRKLLTKDVRVEQRKMLQIVHFLVENEFLRSSGGEKADVHAKEKIEVLKSEDAEPVEASEPIQSQSEGTESNDAVMEEASVEHVNTDSAVLCAAVDEKVLPSVEAIVCEEAQEKPSEVVESSLDGGEVKAAKEEDVLSSEAVNPEAVAGSEPSKDVEEVVLPTTSQADTLKATDSANEANAAS